MRDAVCSQDPVVIVPRACVSALPTAAPTVIAARRKMTDREIKQYLKTADALSTHPWLYPAAAEYLREWANGKATAPRNVDFVISPAIGHPYQPTVLCNEIKKLLAPVQFQPVTVSLRRPKAKAKCQANSQAKAKARQPGAMQSPVPGESDTSGADSCHTPEQQSPPRSGPSKRQRKPTQPLSNRFSRFS